MLWPAGGPVRLGRASCLSPKQERPAWDSSELKPALVQTPLCSRGARGMHLGWAGKARSHARVASLACNMRPPLFLTICLPPQGCLLAMGHWGMHLLTWAQPPLPSPMHPSPAPPSRNLSFPPAPALPMRRTPTRRRMWPRSCRGWRRSGAPCGSGQRRSWGACLPRIGRWYRRTSRGLKRP